MNYQNGNCYFPQLDYMKNGKQCETRDFLSPEVIAHMVRYYEIKRNPSKEDLTEISLRFSVPVDRIKLWFETQQNNDAQAFERLNANQLHRYS